MYQLKIKVLLKNAKQKRITSIKDRDEDKDIHLINLINNTEKKSNHVNSDSIADKEAYRSRIRAKLVSGGEDNNTDSEYAD